MKKIALPLLIIAFISCKKDNPTPAAEVIDGRLKFIGSWTDAYTFVGTETDTLHTEPADTLIIKKDSTANYVSILGINFTISGVLNGNQINTAEYFVNSTDGIRNYYSHDFGGVLSFVGNNLCRYAFYRDSIVNTYTGTSDARTGYSRTFYRLKL